MFRLSSRLSPVWSQTLLYVLSRAQMLQSDWCHTFFCDSLQRFWSRMLPGPLPLVNGGRGLGTRLMTVRRAWQTFHMATQIKWCLISSSLTLLEQFYGVSGQQYSCPKSLQQHVQCVCCPPPVLYVVFHWSREFRQIYRCDGLSLHLPSHTGMPCVHGISAGK